MSIRSSIATIVRRAFPRLFWQGVYRYRVVSVSAGRIDAAPVVSRLWTLPRLYQWSGPGIEGTPVAGSQILVMFVDGDWRDPVCVGFAPLRLAKPDSISIDANNTISMAGGGPAMHRVGDLGSGGTLTVDAPGVLKYTGPDGTTWSLTFLSAIPASPVGISFTPPTADDGKIITKAVTGSGKVNSG